LSIEKMREQNAGEEQAHFLVYRNILGATFFSGVISKKIAKVKEINDKPHKYKVKVAVAVKDYETKKYVQEFCEIKFSNDSDRKAFIKVFSSVAGIE
jgi:hypothetical protein